VATVLSFSQTSISHSTFQHPCEDFASNARPPAPLPDSIIPLHLADTQLDYWEGSSLLERATRRSPSSPLEIRSVILRSHLPPDLIDEVCVVLRGLLEALKRQCVITKDFCRYWQRSGRDDPYRLKELQEWSLRWSVVEQSNGERHLEWSLFFPKIGILRDSSQELFVPFMKHGKRNKLLSRCRHSLEMLCLAHIRQTCCKDIEKEAANVKKFSNIF
jgi:hypothetical protein